MESEIRRFTREVVGYAQMIVADPAEPAAPAGGGRFGEWTMLALHCLRVRLGKSYRETVDLLREMPGILAELGLERPPHFTTLCAWFGRLPMSHWRTLLAVTAQQGPARHAAIDATGFDRGQFSRYYAQKSGYQRRSLKVTALVDVDSLAVLDVHCTTSGKDDQPIGRQVARRNAGDLRLVLGDKGYDAKQFREQLTAAGIVPQLRYREFTDHDRAHNDRLDANGYGRRWMVETAFSTIKRTIGTGVRARAWYLQFREIVAIAAVYNITRRLRQ